MSGPTPLPETIALTSCMRNEGLFVLEWIAYHQTLGFDGVVIVTNDCTDGSDTLLDLLADHGVVTHIRQTLSEGDIPQDQGMDLALAHLREIKTTWCLHIDSDEFLLIEAGEGHLTDLMQNVSDADCVPIIWRNFGDSGLTDWTAGDSVLNAFTQAEAASEPGQSKSKCLFRVASFNAATDHNPLDPTVTNPSVKSADGAAMANAPLFKRAKVSRFRPYGLPCKAKTARINHYAVKSQDLFLMKNDRGDGQGKRTDDKYHLGSRWHAQANRNDVTDRAILRHWPATTARLADLRALPGVAAAEQHCQNWFTKRRAAILTDAQRQTWTKGAMTA
ncbi:glycosyltransferase family 2 protein [Thalassobius sp. Cn5-15]|nr:glycosyltransferase family 2 protein [Thalassobius sp. Cn5-15]